MYSPFVRQELRPLPDFENAQAMYDWLQPLMLRTWSKPYWNQVYFFLSFKIALTAVSTMLMIRLIHTGQFWVFRPVRVRRGTILVPKATDATIFLGACFIAVDAAYRIKVIQWFRGPHYQRIENFMLLEGMRLYPAFCAAWVHLCASSLIWPLQADTLHPMLWHLGFFGVPILFAATFIPTMVIADGWIHKAVDVYFDLEPELLANPTAPVTQSMRDQAFAVYSHWTEAAYWCGPWALVGGLFVGILLVAVTIVGYTLLSRVHRTYSRIPVDTASHMTWSTLDASVRGSESGHEYASKRVSTPVEKPKISPLRLIKYLAGVAPLAHNSPEVLDGPLPPATVRQILRNFFIHSFLELVSIWSLLAVIFSVVIYMTVKTYPEIVENKYDATYGNMFVRTDFTFHIIELWAVVIFGSTLVISMLKRQAYPLRVDTSNPRARVRRGKSRITPAVAASGIAGLNLAIDQEEAFDDELDHKRTISSSSRPKGYSDLDAAETPETVTGEWPAGHRRANSSASAVSGSPLADRTPSVRRTPAAKAVVAPVAPAVEDLSWYAGQGTGRSIVLQALASGASNDLGGSLGRKAAWRTAYPPNDPELANTPASPTHKFATPHGIIGGSVPLTDLSPANSPRTPRSYNRFSFQPSPRH